MYIKISEDDVVLLNKSQQSNYNGININIFYVSST